MKIVPLIAATALVIPASCLMCGCQKADPFASGNHAPVNEAAMPTPEVTATDSATPAANTPEPAGTPPTPSLPGP